MTVINALSLHSVSIPTPPGMNSWNSDGVLILPGLIEDALIDAYCAEWREQNGFERIDDETGIIHARNLSGYRETDYMRLPQLMAMCTHQGVADAVEGLLGEPAGVHLNLSGWVTTERDYHTDTYLNEKCVGDYYAAVWVALDDISPDSGPFQYIPGSHLWGCTITKELIGHHVNLSDPMWPKYSEDVLSPIFEREIVERGAEVVSYLPRKGDVLVWHGNLAHRGSRATIHHHYRPSLIFHMSGINHRTDFPHPAKQTRHGGWYFPYPESHASVDI